MVKLLEDGSIERYTAYLVGKGFLQVSEIDFSETFELVTRYDLLRLLTALLALYNLDTAQLNVKSVFTYGPLDVEILVTPPPELGFDNEVLLLNRVLYGLK